MGMFGLDYWAMAEKQQSNSLPELREIVKEQDRRVYNFCEYMLFDQELVENLVVGIFMEFGKYYRRLESRQGSASELELKIRLFQIAWMRIDKHLAAQDHRLHTGRDTRQMLGFGEDLLRAEIQKVDESLREQIFERLLSLDSDFRAPVVLRDIMKFSDDEVTQILGVRWGVYRHRLNRGRLDFANYLRGRLISGISRASATV